MPETMKVRYVGPHDWVEVPIPGGRPQLVRRGELLETTVEHARRLLEQPTNWREATPPRREAAKAVTKPSAEKES